MGERYIYFVLELNTSGRKRRAGMYMCEKKREIVRKIILYIIGWYAERGKGIFRKSLYSNNNYIWIITIVAFTVRAKLMAFGGFVRIIRLYNLCNFFFVTSRWTTQYSERHEVIDIRGVEVQDNNKRLKITSPI